MVINRKKRLLSFIGPVERYVQEMVLPLDEFAHPLQSLAVLAYLIQAKGQDVFESMDVIKAMHMSYVTVEL